MQLSWGLAHPVVTQLPFSTSFNTGAGFALFQRGAVTGSAGGAGGAGGSDSCSWYNLLATDTLPCARDPLTQQVNALSTIGAVRPQRWRVLARAVLSSPVSSGSNANE